MSQAKQFSKREKEVIELLLQGKSNKQIALALNVTESTVEFHLNHIYTKLNVNSRAEAILQLGKPTAKDSIDELGDSLVDENGKGEYYLEKPIVKFFRTYKIIIIIGITLATVLVFLLVKNINWSYEREGEFPDEHTVGQTIERSNASG